jgi:hypothetical protein
VGCRLDQPAPTKNCFFNRELSSVVFHYATERHEFMAWDVGLTHRYRYLMTRLLTSRLPVTSCIIDSAAIYIMVVKFRNTICPPPLQLSLHRRAALSSNSNGTRSVYSRENPKRSVYCEMSVA